MKNTLETRLGIFVALTVIAAVLILETVGGVDRLRRGYLITGLFKNVQELKVGDRVKMAGVEIGRVQDIGLTNNKVLVSMKVTGRYRSAVKTDSVAAVKFAGLLGQNFVAIEFGTPAAPPISEGSLINTAEQPDMGEILQKLDNVATGVENLTKSFTGDKIDNLFGPLTDFMKANKDPLTLMISNFKSISTQISQGKGSLGKMIYDDSLYNVAFNSVSNLQDTASDLKLTLADARKVLDEARTGEGTLGKLFTDATLYNETTASMTTLKEILQKMNQGQGTIGMLLNDPGLYSNARLTLQKVDKATESLEDQGPLSVLGLIVGKLF